MVKFIKAEPLKGGKTMLHFGAGNRLLVALADAALRVSASTPILCQ